MQVQASALWQDSERLPALLELGPGDQHTNLMGCSVWPRHLTGDNAGICLLSEWRGKELEM